MHEHHEAQAAALRDARGGSDGGNGVASGQSAHEIWHAAEAALEAEEHLEVGGAHILPLLLRDAPKRARRRGGSSSQLCL